MKHSDKKFDIYNGCPKMLLSTDNIDEVISLLTKDDTLSIDINKTTRFKKLDDGSYVNDGTPELYPSLITELLQRKSYYGKSYIVKWLDDFDGVPTYSETQVSENLYNELSKLMNVMWKDKRKKPKEKE